MIFIIIDVNNMNNEYEDNEMDSYSKKKNNVHLIPI